MNPDTPDDATHEPDGFAAMWSSDGVTRSFADGHRHRTSRSICRSSLPAASGSGRI